MKQKKKTSKAISTSILLFLAMFILGTIPACSPINKAPKMYIEVAKLTEQEEKLTKLLGADGDQLIYDFKVDDTVQSMQVNTYELKNGVWHLVVGGGGQTFEDAEGRLALSVEKLAEGIRIALQSEKKSGFTKYTINPTEELEGMSHATSTLNDLTEILYEKEIPLVIQVLTTQNAISAYNLEFFYRPEVYMKYDHEYVYAVTIKFSQKTVNELS